MQKEGLPISEFSEALALLRRLDRASENARDTLLEFLEILGAERRFLEIGAHEIYKNATFSSPIFTVEGAEELLHTLSLHHVLALVSNGDVSQQMEKLKKAGIDSRIFSKIAISEEKCKRSRYEVIVEELGFSPSQVVVCGDRISVDLTPAKELGFKTVHVRWGRGMNSVGMKSDVDYTISSLKEVSLILKCFKS